MPFRGVLLRLVIILNQNREGKCVNISDQIASYIRTDMSDGYKYAGWNRAIVDLQKSANLPTVIEK